MKVIFGILIMTASAQASISDNNTDAKEIANAMAHCPAQVSTLVADGEYVSSVTGTFKQISETVSSKTYVLTSNSGGWSEPIRSGARLTIQLTVTQPPVGVQVASKGETWECSINR